MITSGPLRLHGSSSLNNRELSVPSMATGNSNNRSSSSVRCLQAAAAAAAVGMAFNGTWKVYSEENLDEFLKVIGAPEMVAKMRREMKPTFVIERSGQDFTVTMKTPVCSRVNSFTIGKEAELSSVDGKKFKCVVKEEDGKLITQSDKFTSVREIQGDEMVEMITAGSVTFVSRSKRV